MIDSVPFYPQERYQCGPAALAMLLAWGGTEVPLAQLTAQVYSPALKGSLQPSIISAARRHGHLAYPLSGYDALLAELRAGHPVLLLQNLGLSWLPRWHYAVVIGYDPHKDVFLLHSGTQAQLSLSRRLFDRLWTRADNWGLAVLPPDRLPAAATVADLLPAIVGLERAQQYRAAQTAYRAALTRWPENPVAWMGLGNSTYALDDLEEAVRAFRRAVALQPDNGVPLNNLALVLADLGRFEEALEVIATALSRGGTLQKQFHTTREEILLRHHKAKSAQTGQ
ncbi:MAG: PA2778 family cysteine peptidase [Pelovirga sp.]